MADQIIKGIVKSDYQAWRHHPVTKVIMGFLTDKQDFMQTTALDSWIGGSLSLQADQTMRGQIIELIELRDLSFEVLVGFYGEESENAEEVNKN